MVSKSNNISASSSSSLMTITLSSFAGTNITSDADDASEHNLPRTCTADEQSIFSSMHVVLRSGPWAAAIDEQLAVSFASLFIWPIGIRSDDDQDSTDFTLAASLCAVAVFNFLGGLCRLKNIVRRETVAATKPTVSFCCRSIGVFAPANRSKSQFLFAASFKNFFSIACVSAEQ